MTKTIWMSLLLAASGCAASHSMTRHDGAGFCMIEAPAWPSASADYNRGATLDVIGKLTTIADDDRAKLHGGVINDIGMSLDRLTTPKAERAFIASDVAELATRLRQLDCAVRANHLAFDVADQRYGQILTELRVERNIFDPPPVSLGGTQAPAASSP